MPEMRFNQSDPRPNHTVYEEVSVERMPKRSGSYLKPLLILVLTVVVLVGGFLTYKAFAGNAGAIASDSFYSVFIDNGQVYFGKMVSKDKESLVISNVFYLQVASSTGAKFNLMKLGSEIHGPKDEMIINMAHVLFYEEMRDDSQVVQSIKGQ